MTVEELANKRYSGEFVFVLGHLEGITRFVFECFDPRPDHEGKNTYMVSYFDKGLRRRDVVDVPCYMTVIFIEGKANEADFIEVTQEYSFLKNKVKKLAELYHDGEWLATGKLNQDPPTNKERFQFTLDKDDIINMIRGVDLDPYSDVANEMEKIGLGSSSDSSYEGPIWSWFVNKVELWQKNNVWDSFSAEFLWGLYCRIKKV